MQKLSLASGKRHLFGSIFGASRAGSARRAVLFIHGQSSSQKGYEPRALLTSRDLDAVCLTFDLSGHGDDAANFGRYSICDHVDDAVAAYDYFVSREGVDRSRVGVCGASYGAYLAALLTGRRAVKRLILRAPSLASDVEFPNGQGRPSVSGGAPAGFDSLKILGSYAGEVLIIESEKDEVIPPSHIAAYLRVCSHAQHQVIPAATHSLDPRSDQAFVKSIVGWFKDL